MLKGHFCGYRREQSSAQQLCYRGWGSQCVLDLALLHKRVNCWPHRTLLSAADGSALGCTEEKSATHMSEDWVTRGMRWHWRAVNCILMPVWCVGCWGIASIFKAIFWHVSWCKAFCTLSSCSSQLTSASFVLALVLWLSQLCRWGLCADGGRGNVVQITWDSRCLKTLKVTENVWPTFLLCFRSLNERG